MSDVVISSNLFHDVPFPLVLGDRFFTIYRNDAEAKFTLDAFRWDESTSIPVYEVKSGEPIASNMTTNPTGVVTFAAEDHCFQFKFRPKPGVSSIFGRVPLGEEFSVVFRDGALKVMRGNVEIVNAMDNIVQGTQIGVTVGVDGSVSIGGNLPPGVQLNIDDSG